MSKVLTKVKALYGRFTRTERILADYILGHAEDVPFMSVQRLSKSAKVSLASVSRFARAAGYDNIRVFKAQLGRDFQAQASIPLEAIKPGDHDGDVVQKVFLGSIRSLEDTLKVTDTQGLRRAADKLARAERIVFFGFGGSGSVAEDAGLRFSHLGIRTKACIDSYQMIEEASWMRTAECAVGISHSGRSSVVVRALEIARKNGAFTIGISNYLESPLHKASEAFFLTAFSESGVRAAALSSRLAQSCLIDAMYVLAARHTTLSEAAIVKMNANIERHLRDATR